MMSKGRECIGNGRHSNYNLKLPLKPNKNSKVSNQTHIVEELSENGEVQYHCTACRKKFRSRTQKYYHLQCNNQLEERYKCDMCAESFARLSQLKYHRESHSSSINECQVCLKTFSNPLALKKHEALHKVEPKTCPHCDKTFLKKNSLEQHIAAQHLHQLQYGCAYCNKKYASKSTLQQHLQSHEKKRFECSFCGKLFQRNSILNLHMKRHYRTSTYTCKVCEKIFTESGALARHRKIHEENSLQYHCLLCDKNILRKDNMTRHMNTIHPDGKYEDVVQVIKPCAQKHIDRNPETCEENSWNKDGASKGQGVKNYDGNSIVIERENSAKSFTNICEVNLTESQSNFVIIENKLLQIPLLHAHNHLQLGRNQSEEDLNKEGDRDNEIENNTVIGDHFSTSLMDTPIVKKIQVITTLPVKDTNLNEFKAPYDTTIRHISTCNSVEYNQVSQRPAENQTVLNSTSLLSSQTELVVCNTIRSPQTNNTFETQHLQQENSTTTSFQESWAHLPNSHLNMPSNDFEHANHQIRYKPSVIRSIGNVKKKLSSDIINEPITGKNISSDYQYKHKKYNRHYNVDLYRKILGCDDDDYDNDDYVEQISCLQSEGQQEDEILAYNHQQDNSIGTTNTTTVHWRKCFKNIYETSTS